jgi:ATP-dependent 26S proteasome regulatory subunit
MDVYSRAQARANLLLEGLMDNKLLRIEKTDPVEEKEDIIEGQFFPEDDNVKYLDGFFEIFSQMGERAAIMKTMPSAALNIAEASAVKGAKTCWKKKKNVKAKSRIPAITRSIVKKEEKFWISVEKSEAQGKRFIVEEIARNLGLGRYEKKIILYFLYLELTEERNKRSTISEVLEALDMKGSLAERVKFVRCFDGERPILKNKLITPSLDSFSERQPKYGLSRSFYFMLSRALNGEAVSLASLVRGETDNESEDVGYLKDPDYSLGDVTVNKDILEEVKLFLDSIKDGRLSDTGVFNKVRKGKGNIFLFYGPPGTGKSMMAEAVADYIGKKALIVEFPKIMSRWLGETDKNIMKIFDIAKHKKVVIIMDEADSLLYSREYAQWDHDVRFVNELLQALEKFEGEIILTTNMEVLLDSAVERRVSLKVRFELPDIDTRARIWKWHLPDGAGGSDASDLEFLAEKYEFSGGNIKNAVLNAARKASSRGEKRITMEDLVFGAELEKKGMFSKKYKTKVVKGFSMGSCTAQAIKKT